VTGRELSASTIAPASVFIPALYGHKQNTIDVLALATILGRHNDSRDFWNRGCCGSGTVDTSCHYRVCNFVGCSSGVCSTAIDTRSPTSVRRWLRRRRISFEFCRHDPRVEAFVLPAVGAMSINPMRPYFETVLGATLVAIAIALIGGMFVASGRLLQQRRFGLVLATLFLILLWMFFWEIAVEIREEKLMRQARSGPSSASTSKTSQAA